MGTGIVGQIREFFKYLAIDTSESKQPYQELLPYGQMLTDTDVLLHEPLGLRKGRHPVPHYFAIGRMWEVEPRNVDAMGEAPLTQLAQTFISPLNDLTIGTVMEFRWIISPCNEMPEWEAARAHLTGSERPKQIDAFLAHIAKGMPHTIGTRDSRLMRSRCYMGLRMPVAHKEPIGPQHDAFCVLAGNIEAQYGSNNFKPRALDGSALLDLIIQSLCPGADIPTYYDDEPLRGSVIVPRLTLGVDRYRCDDLEAHIFSLRKATPRTYPFMLSALRKPDELSAGVDLWTLAQDYPVEVITQITVPNQQKLEASVSAKRKWGVKKRKGTAGEDRTRVRTQMDDLEAFEERLATNSEIGVLMGVHFKLWGKAGEFGPKDAMLKANLRRIGAEAVRETLNANSMFLYTLPLARNLKFPKEETLRRMRRLPVGNAVHFIPFGGTFRGYGNRTPGVALLNERGEVVYFDPLADNARPHIGVVGSNRGGKSAAMALMANQLLPLGATFIFVDRHGSYRRLCEMHNGNHFGLNLNDPTCFGPFDGPLDQDHLSFLVNIMVEMCTKVTQYETSTLSHPQSVILGNMLQQWANRGEWDSTPTITHFWQYIRDNPYEGQKELCDNILILLSPFCGDGRFAGFIDGPNKVDLKRGLWSFDLAPLGSEAQLLSVLTTVLFSRVDTFIRQHHGFDHPIYFVVDEAHASLKSPKAADMIERCFREYARMYVSISLITQQIQDFKGWIGDVVKNNCGSLWSFALNPGEARAFVEECQLPPHMLKIIRTIGRHDRGDRSCSEGIVYLPGVSGSSDGEGGQFVVVGDPEFFSYIGQAKHHQEAQKETL